MLPSNTLITLCKDSQIEISSIVDDFKPGVDAKILGCHEKSNKRVTAEVMSTRSSSAKDFIYITTSSGEHLKITPPQKIFNAGEKSWIYAHQVAIGTQLLKSDRTITEVVDVHEIHDKVSVKVYTLTIDTTQNYYANNILVHNTSVQSLMPPGTTFYWKMLPPKKSRVPMNNIKTDKGMTGLLSKAGGWGPAPRLAPISESSGAVDKNALKPSTFLNVKDMHHWTESPISARSEVPILMLKEKSIMVNPMVNQMIQNIGVLSGNLDKFNQAGTVFGGTQELESMETLQNYLGQQGSSLGAQAGQVKTLVGTVIADASKGLTESGYANPLAPYDSLYITQPSGFKYSLPYLQNKWVETSHNFGGESTESNNMGILEGINAWIQTAGEVTGNLAGNKILAPGRMIEQPDGFTFSGREKSYTVTFPLFNTKDFAEIIKNWQFIFLLTYQNTPNRISRDLIDPPCIYEAYIPGVWYSPYASITNMTVNFKGARREMELPVPYLSRADSTSEEGAATWLNEKKKIRTIIPDAYEVTITITELFAQSQNFIYHMLAESMDDKITVSTKGDTR